MIPQAYQPRFNRSYFCFFILGIRSQIPKPLKLRFFWWSVRASTIQRSTIIKNFYEESDKQNKTQDIFSIIIFFYLIPD